MRAPLIAGALAGSLLLSGCAAYGDPLGGLLGGVLGGGYGGGYGSGYGNSEFERAAVNACGQQASQYGRVQITDVRQGGDAVQVTGRVESYDRNRDEFSCTFRSDGRIVDFRLY